MWSNLSKKYGHDVSLPRLVHADPFDSSSTKVDLRNVTVRVTFPSVRGRDDTVDVETSRFKTLTELVDDVVKVRQAVSRTQYTHLSTQKQEANTSHTQHDTKAKNKNTRENEGGDWGG